MIDKVLVESFVDMRVHTEDVLIKYRLWTGPEVELPGLLTTK